MCGSVNPSPAALIMFKSLHSKRKKLKEQLLFQLFGPSVEIRTRGLLNPIQARYQTSPHPDFCVVFLTTSIYYHENTKMSSIFCKILKNYFDELSGGKCRPK